MFVVSRARPAIAFLLLAATACQGADKPDPSVSLFKPTGPVPVFKIEVDKDNLAALNKEPRKHVKATIKVGDETFKEVGLHLKGAAGSFRNWDDKPALTLSFNKFIHLQAFHGLHKIHLNNSVQDPTYLDEIICGEMSLAAGLPACRAAHAIVELNGRKVGFYVLKEGFDKTFLLRHFADPNGNMYDGGFLLDLDGELKLENGIANERKDLKALAAICQEPNAAKQFEALDQKADIDRIVTLAVLQTITTDWDGYCRNRNNYRIYFDPKSGKAVIFPHGMDQMFGQPDEGLWPRWGGMLARVVLDTPEGKKRYAARLKEMTDKNFQLAAIYKRIDELAPRARAAMEAVSKGSGAGYDNEVKALKDRLKQRSEFLAREIPKFK